MMPSRNEWPGFRCSPERRRGNFLLGRLMPATCVIAAHKCAHRPCGSVPRQHLFIERLGFGRRNHVLSVARACRPANAGSARTKTSATLRRHLMLIFQYCFSSAHPFQNWIGGDERLRRKFVVPRGAAFGCLPPTLKSVHFVFILVGRRRLHASSQTVVRRREKPRKSISPDSYGCCEPATIGQN